jgi:hypothetical protein
VKKIIVYFSLTALLVACGGRVADPVAQYKPGDEAMSCGDLKAELSHVEQEVNKLLPESKKTGKNVALGAAGLFLIFPWFFMDMSTAEKTEIKAYNERYLALEKLYRNKCSGIEYDNSGSSNGSTGERLQLLDDLKKDSLITEEEYNSRRTEILDSI